MHVPRLGKGVVREARNGRRYLIDIKGAGLIVSEADLTPLDPSPSARADPSPSSAPAGAGDGRSRAFPANRSASASLDLHGRTVAEAEAATDAFLNDALLAGLAEVRIVHGRGGGRVRRAVHARLKRIPSVRAFRLDPSNPGVTVVGL